MYHLEETINKLSEALFSIRETPSNNNNGRKRSPQLHYEETSTVDRFVSSREDLRKWFNRVTQFFEFQAIADNQNVPLASFHLKE